MNWFFMLRMFRKSKIKKNITTKLFTDYLPKKAVFCARETIAKHTPNGFAPCGRQAFPAMRPAPSSCASTVR